jgi:hypothetical protein
MAYYYVVPLYLTGVFAVSYGLVHVLLLGFDLTNHFWDWWDDFRRRWFFVPALEAIILIGFIYYIVKWELSGTP